jgi:sulfane dehydrogenase subunit SoxC
MDDCLVCYGMNGEAVRPQQGFPLRLIVPGFEGIYQIKYLRRIKVVDRYYMTYDDYGHINPDPKVAALTHQIGTEIRHHVSFRRAAAVRPRILRNHRPGVVRRGRHPQAWKYPPTAARAGRTPSFGRNGPIEWRIPGLASTGTGTEKSVLMSRCTDELGTVQPTRAEVAKFWNNPSDKVRVQGADNSVQPWRIASDGSVHNGLA